MAEPFKRAGRKCLVEVNHLGNNVEKDIVLLKDPLQNRTAKNPIAPPKGGCFVFSLRVEPLLRPWKVKKHRKTASEKNLWLNLRFSPGVWLLTFEPQEVERNIFLCSKK